MKPIPVFLLFVFSFLGLSSQTVKVYISDSIQVRDGKRYYIHQVTQGQTLYAIAKAYDVSVDELIFENPDSGDGISIDEYLWVPTVNRETELNEDVSEQNYKFFYHIIKKGETYSSLARDYNIPVDYIIQANQDAALPLREGQYVRIPVDDAFKKLEDISAEEGVSFNPDLVIIPNYRHVVVAGETLYSIARKYQVSVGDIRSVNPGLGETIEIGDRLRIPEPTREQEEITEAAEEEPQEPAYHMHKVQKKETLYSISRLYGVSLLSIYEANTGLTSDIDAGQVIRVPKETVDKPYIIYTANERTRLNKVARLYNIPVNMLQEENPSLRNRILPGQKIRVPVGRKAKVVEEKPEGDEVDVAEKEKIVETKRKTKPCSQLLPDYSKTFEVALMVPFYLEELDSLDKEQFLGGHQDGFTPFRFIRFYEGALLAVDSLVGMGFRINLHVYDVDQSITKTAKVLQSPELQRMDLIIGPFQSKSFDQVALFAGNFNIPIVNPFSFREEVTTRYRSTMKAKPSTRYQADLVAELIRRDYPGSKVFLVTHSAYQAVEEVNLLQQKIDSVIPGMVSVANTDLYNLAVSIAYRDEDFKGNTPLPPYRYEGARIVPEQLSTLAEDSTQFPNQIIRIDYLKDSLRPVFANASALRENVVILFGDNESFYGDAMNRLNELRDTFNIRLIGLPEIERLRYLDELQANKMNLTYLATSFADYEDPSLNRFIGKFRKVYNTDPDIYGFSGFDITYYFIRSLTSLGMRMRPCIEEYPEEMLLNRFDMRKTGNANNYVNSYWNVLRYQNMSVVKLPDLRKTEFIDEE